MKKLALIATAVMTMMAVGCQETLQESLEMTSSEKSVAVEGETSPLSFTASSAWTIASDADWVTFDRTEGEAGDVTVEMTVAANDEYDRDNINHIEEAPVWCFKQLRDRYRRLLYIVKGPRHNAFTSCGFVYLPVKLACRNDIRQDSHDKDYNEK